MRLARVAVAALLLTGLPLAAAAQETFDTRPGIAVFPFENGGSFGPAREDLSGLEVGVQQPLLMELTENPSLRVVERSRLREILDEQGLVTSGQVDPRTAVELGRLVGARYIVTGSFIDNYGQFSLSARIFDVETGEILRAQRVLDRKQNLYRMIVDLSSRVTQGVDLPPLEGPVAQRRRARAIPAEAVTLYSRAQVFEDMGQQDRAIELYRQIARTFPEMTEAQEALRQLTSG
jgi:TolB-like protein